MRVYTFWRLVISCVIVIAPFPAFEKLHSLVLERSSEPTEPSQGVAAGAVHRRPLTAQRAALVLAFNEGMKGFRKAGTCAGDCQVQAGFTTHPAEHLS